ncbi:Major intrinsic protein [Fagus crenata]
MSETSESSNGNDGVLVHVIDAEVIAELLGTYFLVFAGCASEVVNLNNANVITLPGISIVWGLVVMVLIYSLGHISGAHFNPAVPAYMSAQILGAALASATLRLIFSGHENHFAGTVPTGSSLQSYVVEYIITFFVMFVVSSKNELAGLCIGSAVLLNALFAWPISGASMNPARSLGTVIVHDQFKALWIYIFTLTTGAISGAWVYNLIRFKFVTSPSVANISLF